MCANTPLLDTIRDSERLEKALCRLIAKHEGVTSDRIVLIGDFYALKGGYMHVIDPNLRAYKVGPTMPFGDVGYLVCTTAEAAVRISGEFGRTDFQLAALAIVLRHGFNQISDVRGCDGSLNSTMPSDIRCLALRQYGKIVVSNNDEK